MLRTNLSTRPFYNIRAVQAALGALVALAILFTLFNVISLLQLATSQRSLGARAVQAQNDAAKLRADAAQIRGQINAKELEVVSAAAREAKSIIEMRAFSWTDLLAQFEKTLPENVRITAVQPRLEKDGRFIISMRVEAKEIGDVEKFLEDLERTGAFHNVLTTDEQATEDGLLEALIEGSYVQQAASAADEKSVAQATTNGGRALSD
jgi:phosphoglycolate phosphatase-like HAD superfamily hydrolase